MIGFSVHDVLSTTKTLTKWQTPQGGAYWSLEVRVKTSGETLTFTMFAATREALGALAGDAKPEMAGNAIPTAIGTVLP